MRIHYVLHAAFEKLGVIEDWLNKHNYLAAGTHTYKNELLPSTAEFDLLIVMGGPQSASNIKAFPYLQAEVSLIKQAIKEKKAILGICLGAQLVGLALEAKVEPSPQKEIGVFPIMLTEQAKMDPLFKQFNQEFSVMHWHSDMAGLPNGAVLLASSAGCPRQAFRFGDRVYALQYHLELTPELVQQMVEHCRDELQPGTYVQTAHELMQLNLHESNQKMFLTLDYLAGCVKQNKLATNFNDVSVF